MKLSKRIISIALCAVMLLGLSISAFAAPPTYTLTINNDVDGHTYEAYQIFYGDLAEKDGKQILSNIEWGSSISDPAALLAEINADDELTVLHDSTDAASLATKLAIVTSDSETIDHFAEVISKYLDTTPAGTSTDEGNHYEISGLHAGYYLIKDKDDSLNNKYDAYTRFILRVLKSLDVTPKSNIPAVNKTINDTVDGTFTENEDFDIGDTAYYKWEGTLPSNLQSFDKYHYRFVDSYSEGLTFLRIEQVYIEGHDGNRVHTFMDLTDADTYNDTLPAGITTDAVEKQAGAASFYVDFNDLLTLYPSILPTHKVIVKYSAMINRDALIESPNDNEVYLVYSNNPNGNGEGKTTIDEAHAFTFKIVVDKYDADDTAKKLEGAEFVLYYERIEVVDGVDTKVKYYAKVVTEEDIANGLVVNGKKVDDSDLGVVYGWDNKAHASVLDTDNLGALTVKGLDGGLYYLEETKAPAGYNLMESPVAVNIVPSYNADGSLNKVVYEVDSIEQSSSTVGVRNSSGSTLPITGGIGTVIFYVIGAMLVLGACVILVAKKRGAAEG